MGFQWNLLQQCNLLHYKMFLLLCNLKPTPETKNMFLNSCIETFILTLFMRTQPHWECVMKLNLFVPRKTQQTYLKKNFVWYVCRFLLWYVFYRNSHDDLYYTFMSVSWNWVLPISWMIISFWFCTKFLGFHVLVYR